jgi:tetratricopeptide (TPR) repeat protein
VNLKNIEQAVECNHMGHMMRGDSWFKSKAFLLLGSAAALCSGAASIHAQQPNAANFDPTYAVAKAREYCSILWSDHAFDRIRDKVPLGEDKPTSSMLTNTQRLRQEDTPLADLAIKVLKRCRAAHAPVYAILPPQVNTLTLGFQQRQDAVIAELYVGKITFGEYNVNMNRIAGDVAAQWLFEASDLNKRAIEFDNAGRYSDAEPLYTQSLAMREEVLDPDHADVAQSLNNLATLYQRQGRYSDAEPLFKRSLAINEKAFSPDHPAVALSSNNLALLYQDKGRYADAEPLYKRALAINEKVLGHDHPHVAATLNNLASLYQVQGHYADAEPLYQRSLAIKEKVLGPNHIDVALSLSALALLYSDQGRYADAEPLYKRSLAIREKKFGPVHPDVAQSLNNLALLYYYQGHYAAAEPLYKRAIAINEKALGPDHPHVASSLDNLASLYQAQSRYADAEPLYKRSLAIREKQFGPVHPDVAATLNNLAALYESQSRYADAEPLYKRSLAIKENALGPDHPAIAATLNNLAELYRAQDRYGDAEPLYKRALAINEKALGPDHPGIAPSLNNLALLYQVQRRYADAEPLFKRSLAIKEKSLGFDHPDVASSLNNLALLYQAQGRDSDALPLVKRTISQNSTNKSIAFAVLHDSEYQKLIAPNEALNTSYTVLQRSISMAAGEAISKLAARFAAGTDELAQLVPRDQDLTAEAERLDKSIIAAVSKPPAARNQAAEDQKRKRIDEIKLERDQLQSFFNQRFPDYVALSKPQPLTIEQTQALLADEEALVAIDLDKSSYVWVITKGRAEWKYLAVSVDDVSKAVETLRTGLNPDIPSAFDRNLAYQLYLQVLGPIEGIISGKTRLSFVFDGALTSLPPQVLITTDPDGKDLASLDWLVRKYAVTVLPSIASLKIL